MKKILCFAALLGFINHASAQNSNPWPATGDVGIGTASPASALHIKTASAVAGFSNITVENSGATGNEAGINFKAGYTTTSLNSGRIYSLFDGGTGSANARLTLQSLVANGVYDNTLTVRSGNVGIGTTNPAFSLGSGLEIERLGPATLRLQNTTDSKSMELRQTSTDFSLFNVNGQNTILSQNGGNVGIGTTTPGLKTHINGITGFPATTGTAQTGVLRLQGLSNNAVLDFGVNGVSGAYLQSTNQTALNANYPLFLNPNGGNVGIGTTDTKGYKFAVNGNVIATAVTVKLYADWPDYVFKKEYKLPTLTEVKNYIDKNQHLPDMPSEKEVAENGLNLGEMNKILTKKVEELTLYLIQQNKRIDDQQKQINQLIKAKN